jgi:hypothetical protein
MYASRVLKGVFIAFNSNVYDDREVLGISLKYKSLPNLRPKQSLLFAFTISTHNESKGKKNTRKDEAMESIVVHFLNDFSWITRGKEA